METPPTTAPSQVPPRFIVGSAVEFNRAGGWMRYGETNQQFYTEMISRARAQASDPAAVDAAVKAVEAEPSSPNAARRMEAALGALKPDRELIGVLEKLLQQMADRPTATDLLREMRGQGAAKEGMKVNVAGDFRGVIGDVHRDVTFN